MYLNYQPKHVIVYSPSEYLYDVFDKVLLSLGKIFTGANFNYRTLLRFSKKIQNVRKIYPNNTIYIDSGGYSVIVGDIPEYSIAKLIELYSYFIGNYYKYFDKVFSLDIPLSLKLDINYYDKLLKLNLSSQEKTINVLKDNDELRNKIYFVWQFKTRKLFDIWRRIFEELELWKYYKYYAVGGLVGLKNFANIRFSGYIVPVLYTVFIYQEHYSNIKDKIYYHILGQYSSVDQLTILVIEKFIKEKYNLDFNITYDSAAIHSEFINIKDNKIYFYDFYGKNILDLNHLNEIVNDNIHFHINNNKEIFQNIANQVLNGERIPDIDAGRFIYGLHIVSREYAFSKIIDNIIDILINNNRNIKSKLFNIETYLKKIRYQNKLLSNIITQQFIKSFLNNMKSLLHFSNKYSIETKNDMMDKWIELIGLNEFIK